MVSQPFRCVVDWANKIIKFEENLAENTDALHLEKKNLAKHFQEILGWIHSFSQRIGRPVSNRAWAEIRKCSKAKCFLDGKE